MFMKKNKCILTIIVLFIFYIYTSYITLIPENVILLYGENFGLRKIFGIDIMESTKVSTSNSNTSTIELKLFGNFVLKKVNVTTLENTEVVPVGKIIGLKLYTNGVLIVGMSDIEDSNKILIRPYEKSDIKEGDTILKINDNEIEDIDELQRIVNNSNGKDLILTLMRGDSILTTSIKPVQVENKEYRLGLWVKDAATGVGTMTFYEPKSQVYAVLGHGITDSDTDELINIDSGELVTTKVISLQKGEIGNPGEIKGTIVNQKSIGNVIKNTQFGVFGILNNLTSLNIDNSKTMKVALREEIKLGNAKILCALDDSNVVKEYDIEIEKIYIDNDYNNKSMLIKITDKELLEKTGGIIRGLSGAPIIQNGMFVGAVTNVLVSNPEIGYAVFSDMMIKQLK